MIRSPLLARADLLRALDCAGDDAAAARRYAGLLGFELQPAVATISGAISVRAVVGPAPATLVEAAARAPLRAPLFAITACRRLEDVPGEDSAGDGVPPLTPADCAPRRRDGDAAPFVALVRQPRLWPALRRSALETHHAGLDLPRLQRELAGARPLRRLPRRWRSGWGGELVVVWDCAERLQPYQDDFRAIVTDLLRQRGTGGFSVWLVDGSPRELRQRWPEKLGRPGSGSGPAALPDAMPLPAPATRVLILSDAGALAALASPSGRAPANAWTDFARRLAQHGAQAVVWAPLAPRQVNGELTRRADVFCLHPAGGLRRRRGGVANDEQRRAESARLHALRERMLARMAFCVRVEPALLRALRGASAASAAEPALEALLWTHQPVVGDSHVSRALTPAYLESYRQAFQALPAAEQVQALDAARQVHAWRGRATEAAEASIWQAHACAEAQGECGDRVEEARQWFAALTARATRGSTADAGLRDYARDLLARNGADRRWVAANSAWLSPVWLASGAPAAPSGLRDEDLAQAIAARSELPELDCQLGVGAQGLLLWRGEPPPGPGHSPIGPPLRVKRLQVSDADGPRLLDPAAAPQCVAPLASLAAAGAGLTLFAGRHAWRVAGIERPAWAHEIGRDACGLYADLLVPLPGAAPDDPQAIRQRCRWIEAGHFRMGSPADEPERGHNEVQHEVTLSRGFWLADTTCTQALWQAVTGANPSEFQDDVRNPVENVSWNDVQTFLSELNRRVPGLQARLPSEAEWEYACRAGTTTPFSFGDDISPEQVNYDGDFPYAGGEKGLHRGKTVPVGSLPANPWGLYEMHGNVWEWCADWYGDYPTAPQLDPTGLQTGGSRVLRGGSWDYGGWSARCAARRRDEPGYRYQIIGFRFAPGQAEPDGATEWLPPRDGAAGAAGRGAASARGTGAVPAAARSAAAARKGASVDSVEAKQAPAAKPDKRAKPRRGKR